MTDGDLKQQFGAAVRSKRSALGISQEELADRSGLHRTYISDVERGARNVSLESIEKLANALKLTVAGLFDQASEDQAAAARVEILLVEDMKPDLDLTLRAFRKARFSNPVHVARDGAEALDFLFAEGAFAHRAGERLPGVILLDLNLPKVDGLEVLRRLKADGRTKRIPVVVLTISRNPLDFTECRRLGAETYIVKPVDFRSFSEVTPLLDFEWALLNTAEKTTGPNRAEAP